MRSALVTECEFIQRDTRLHNDRWPEKGAVIQTENAPGTMKTRGSRNLLLLHYNSQIIQKWPIVSANPSPPNLISHFIVLEALVTGIMENRSIKSEWAVSNVNLIFIQYEE